MGYTLCVLGCGTMGVAVLSGVLSSLDARYAQSILPESIPHSSSGASTPMPSYALAAPEEALPTRFIACVNRRESVKRVQRVFTESIGRRAQDIEVVSGENVKAVEQSDVILLSCKPQQAEAILTSPGMLDALEGKLVLSILAGVTISQMTAWLRPSTKIIRAMPNTPSKIREGMTVVSPVPDSSPAVDREIILSIFSSIGRCRFLEEKHFDVCTALCGSGPAFVSIVLEALADGAVMMGLPRQEALEMAAQTVQGTAQMILQTGIHPAALKDSVSTPGGCTIAGLLSLEDGKVRSTIARSIQVATEKARDLGQPVKK